MKSMGFKRAFIGDMKAGHTGAKYYQRPFEWGDSPNDLKDLKSFIDECHRQGIQAIGWVPTCTADIDSMAVKEHPDWVLIQRRKLLGQATAAHYMKRPKWLYLWPAAGYLDWAYENLKLLKDTVGLDGVFLDSYDNAARLLNMGDPATHYPVKELADFSQHLRDAGMVVYGEAWSPFLISCFWFQDYMTPYLGTEFALSGSSPFTNRPLSTFVDYFKAVSFNTFIVFDIHPYIENAREFYKKYDELRIEVTKTNNAVNEILDSFGSDFDVIKWKNGTYWRGDKGFVIFVYDTMNALLIGGKATKLSFYTITDGANPQFDSIPDGLLVRGLTANTIIFGSN